MMRESPSLPTLANGTATPLWPADGVPGERRSHPFGPEKHSWPFPDDEHITDVSAPTLTPMIATFNPSATAVVVAPGGGYSILAWDKEGLDIARWLTSLNISALVLKYRVPARPWLGFGEAPLMDAQRAMGLVRANAKSLGINASRVGFMGFSAGGHLTAHLSSSASLPDSAARRAYPSVDAADALSCRPDFSLLMYPWRLVDDATRSRLTLNITSGHPPSFLLQAEDDPTAEMENSLFYYHGLRLAKAPPSELHLYPRGGHGYGRCTVGASKSMMGIDEICDWPGRAALFLETLVRPRRAAAAVVRKLTSSQQRRLAAVQQRYNVNKRSHQPRLAAVQPRYNVSQCHSPSPVKADGIQARHLKAAVRRGALPVVYVQFGAMNQLLKECAKITLGWGNEVVLLSDRPVGNKTATFGPALARRFHYFPIDYSGCSRFQHAYNTLHSRHQQLFANYKFKEELWNEVRYIVLHNFVEALGLEEIVYLDSDVVMLAPVTTVFDPAVYDGCDGVLTFNQISSRVRPVGTPDLDAYWAGTSRLSRATLADYAEFTVEALGDAAYVGLLLGKQRAYPTVNDMTTWCLFVLLQKSSAVASAGLRAVLRRSALVERFGEKRTLCNTQPFSWSGGGALMHGASGEMQGAMFTRDGDRFYVHGDSYLRNYCGFWPDEIHWLNVSAIAGRWWRFLTVHKYWANVDEASMAHFLTPTTRYTGSYNNFRRGGAAAIGRHDLTLGLHASDLGFRPKGSAHCNRPDPDVGGPMTRPMSGSSKRITARLAARAARTGRTT